MVKLIIFKINKSYYFFTNNIGEKTIIIITTFFTNPKVREFDNLNKYVYLRNYKNVKLTVK